MNNGKGIARSLTGYAMVLVAAFFGFAFFFLRFAQLYDGDSYFHLAAARLYADGIPDGLPWARWSLFREGWGDKELLFHFALLPFTRWMDAAVGGRVALAVLNAVLVTLLAFLGRQAVGRWGLLLPLFVYLLPAGFLPRAVRLRPELVALMLLLLAVYLGGRQRWLALAATSALFALSYTAFHVLPGLGLMWMLWERVAGGRWEWRPAAATWGGTLFGLLLHPQLPKNLEVWWANNVVMLRSMSELDVGEEFVAPSLARALAENAPLLAALLALCLAARPSDPALQVRRDRPTAYFAIAALAFVGLYLQMSRMITHAAPLVAATVFFALRARGGEVGAWIEPVRRGWPRLPLAAVLLGCLLAAWPALAHPTLRMLLSQEAFLNEADLERFGRAVPAGAKVAARWQEGEVYTFWAPQGRYLNVLDPVFMALPYPREYAVQRAMFSGHEPDVPLAMAILDSDYLAFDATIGPPAFVARLDGDPRLVPVYTSYNRLLRRQTAPHAFALDGWRNGDGARYPRLRDPRLRAAEGFVDLSRLGDAAGCMTVWHDVALDEPQPLALTFAPWGPGRVAIDGTLVAERRQPDYAILSRGIAVRRELSAGRHRLDVETCGVDGRIGFYLRRDG